MKTKTKLVQLTLQDAFSKCVEVRTVDLPYNTYCKLKAGIQMGYRFSETIKGIRFSWEVKKISLL